MVVMRALNAIVICCVLLFSIALLFPAKLMAQEPYAVNPSVQDCVNVRDDSNNDANIKTCLTANSPAKYEGNFYNCGHSEYSCYDDRYARTEL